ncbi:CPBP family intramembrane glutamic endopeptidase [Glycomyces sp. NPDC047010]|uniref:CPBP family intramembrane glutamic endopeptidase n=1 Tax=Glycomyces sp. NPDC047010 TaxID=3155023 RepID=UPI003401B25B
MTATRAAKPQPPPPTRRSIAFRALAAWAAMGLALGAAGPVSTALAQQWGFGRTGRQALAALIVGLAVTAFILWLNGKADRRSLAALGLGPAGDAARGFTMGVVITGGAAGLVVIPAAAAGWIGFGAVEWGSLLAFLALNALIAFGLEALPEELVFRGYIFTALRRRGGRFAAGLGTTVLFCLIMLPTSAAASATAALLGEESDGLLLAPAGTDPVTYIVLLACFGTALLAARAATGSLWTCIALHLTFLTVNRLVFANADRDTGWQVEPAPDAAVLVLVYVLLAAAVFGLLARVRRRR